MGEKKAAEGVATSTEILLAGSGGSCAGTSLSSSINGLRSIISLLLFIFL